MTKKQLEEENQKLRAKVLWKNYALMQIENYFEVVCKNPTTKSFYLPMIHSALKDAIPNE